MGVRLAVAPGPLDGDWDGVDLVVPARPSQVEWTVRSSATLVALERASRAVGRLETAHRLGSPSIAGPYAIAAIEAHASCALTLGAMRPAQVRDSFLGVTRAAGYPAAATAVGPLMQQLLGMRIPDGLGRSDSSIGVWEERLGVWPSAWGAGGRMPVRAMRTLAVDLVAWVVDGREPALVKAAIAMMVVAAAKPDSPGTGVTARYIAAHVLERALGVPPWQAPPISWGFYGRPDAWRTVASVLAVEGEPKPDALDHALGEALLAIARAANAAAYMVEHTNGVAVDQAGGLRSRKFTPRQRHLLDALTGLPALTFDQAALLAGLSTRGVRRAVSVLLDAGVAQIKTTRDGSRYLVARRRAMTWLDAVHHYTQPGEADPYEAM